MKTICHILFMVSILSLLGACQTNGEPESDAESEKMVIELTQEQLAFNKMEIGKASKQIFAEVVACKGYIKASPNGMAAISSPISGIVKEIYIGLGKQLKKGDIICHITTNELIDIQQKYAETAAVFSKIEADFKRKEKLYAQQVVADKDFQAIQSEYISAKATYQSLKLQVIALNLDPEKIEKGQLFNHFPILAPINGYATKLSVHLGQFVEPNEILAEMVNPKSLQLELSVYENDLSKLKPGQEIRFDGFDDQKPYGIAYLYSIGKSIDTEDKSITCLASIDSENRMGLVNGAYVEADIIVGSKEAASLPAEALLKSGQNYSVLQIDSVTGANYFLSPIEVEIGITENNYTEIITPLPDKKFLLKGAYNLNVE